MKIIRNDVPADAPTNPHYAGTAAWSEWIDNARASTDFVLLIQTKPRMRVSLITYPFLSEYRQQIERGKTRWASLAALLDLAEQVPLACPPLTRKRAARKAGQ